MGALSRATRVRSLYDPAEKPLCIWAAGLFTYALDTTCASCEVYAICWSWKSALARVKDPKPQGARSALSRSSTSARSKSSASSGATTTIGAPWNMFARECAYPEYCVPAIG